MAYLFFYARGNYIASINYNGTPIQRRVLSVPARRRYLAATSIDHYGSIYHGYNWPDGNNVAAIILTLMRR